MQRLDEIIAATGLSSEESLQARSSLELAAFLGPSVSSQEWHTACELAGLEASEVLVDALIDHELARRVGDDWDFSDLSLVEELTDHVRESDTWKKNHALCANALFLVAGPHSPEIARRRIDHLKEAGLFEEVLEPLLVAEKQAYSDGAYEEALSLVDQRERFLDKLGADGSDPRRAQNNWRQARVLQVQGERARALSLINKSREVLEQTDWASERGNAALLQGQMLRDEGRLQEARESFEAATSQFAIAADEFGLASSRTHRGHLELEFGEPQKAREFFEAGLRGFEQIGDTFMMAVVWSQMSYVWLMESNHEEAERCATKARDISREAGHRTTEAGAWNSLGEVARARKDWDEARNRFEKAIVLWLPTHDRNLHIARFNLALVELGVSNFAAAKTLFLDVAERFSELGFGPREPLVHAGLMACSAADEDWQAFEHHQKRVLETVDQLGLGDDDLTQMVHIASRLAGKNGTASAKELARELLLKVR